MKLTEFITRYQAKVNINWIFYAEVISVDTTHNTCVVKVDGDLELENVRLNADIFNKFQRDTSYIFTLYPKIGSAVICGVIDMDEAEAVVLSTSLIDEALFFGNAGANYGFIRYDELRSELLKIMSRIEFIESGILTALPTPSDGGAAALTTMKAQVNQGRASHQPDLYKATIVNEKFKCE